MTVERLREVLGADAERMNEQELSDMAFQVTELANITLQVARRMAPEQRRALLAEPRPGRVA